jgi:hypothetical protein
VRRAVWLAGVMIATACVCAYARETEDIRARDAGVFLPSARLSVDIGKGAGNTPATFGVEFTGGRGSAGQHIDAGAPVQFGRKTFSGPDDLRHDFQFQYFEGTLGFQRPFFYRFPSVGWELGIGFAYASFDLTTSSATLTAKENVDGVLYVVRGGASWEFLPRIRLRLGGALIEGAREPADGITDGGRANVHVAWTPWRYMTVRAGYSWWWLNSAREASDRGMIKSPIHLDFWGPSLGLELMF